VSYEPPLDAITWPLFAAPLFLLLAGLWLARGRFKRRARR
jgi:cytochrome c-type biogenesis protein CcmH